MQCKQNQNPKIISKTIIGLVTNNLLIMKKLQNGHFFLSFKLHRNLPNTSKYENQKLCKSYNSGTKIHTQNEKFTITKISNVLVTHIYKIK